MGTSSRMTFTRPLIFLLVYFIAECSCKVDLHKSNSNKAFIDSIPQGEYEVVHPFQIRDKNERIGIDTRNYFLKAAEHYQSVTIVIRSSHVGRLKLVLERNNYIFLNQTNFLKLDSSGEQPLDKRIENCYYQGSIAGDPNSFVALSSCNGLRGVLAFSNGSAYGIWPLDGGDRGRRHPHVFHKTHWTQEAKCGAAVAAHVRTVRQHHSRHARDISKQTKYVEVALIADHEFVKSHSSVHDEVLTYMLETVNIADLMLSRDLNIRLSVVYLEMWLDVQRIDLFEDIERTVAGVAEYATGHIHGIAKDATLVFTNASFVNNEATSSVFRGICTGRSVALVKAPDTFSAQWSGQLAAQSVGHLLGLEHDTPSCQCEMGANCVMNQHPGSDGSPFAWQFSKCSIARMHGVWQAGQVHCLLNRPFQVSQLRECGNGIVDASEECDCGSREQCNDPCCDPLTCTLRAHAQCAAHHPCCHRCELKKAGEICRASRSGCDVAEVCDGKSGDCPADGHLIDGTTCGEDGQCWRGNCSDPQAQCKNLWGPEAKIAEVACFEQNTNGYKYANCGNGPEGVKACPIEDTRCGTLHCQGGYSTPTQSALNAFSFQFLHNDKQVQCKSIAESIIGLTVEGASCGTGRVCVAGSCVEMTSVSAPVTCPSNNYALQCSSHGDCTTTENCVCHNGWGGKACDIRTNSTLFRNRDDKKQIIVIPSIAAGKSLDTVTLLAILVVVGLFLLLLLVCLLFCYRRRSVVEIPIPNDEKMDDSFPNQTQTTVKFGNMPSYREEKRKHKSTRHIYGALNRITEAEERESLRSRESGSLGAGSQLLFERSNPMPSSRSDVGVPCGERNHDHIYAESTIGISYHNSPMRRQRNHDGGYMTDGETYGMRSFNTWREPRDMEMSPVASPHRVPDPLRLRINNYGQMLKNLQQYDDDPLPMPDLPIPEMETSVNFRDHHVMRYPENEGSAIDVDHEHELASNTESSRYDSDQPKASSDGIASPDQPPTKFDFRQSPSLFSDPFKLDMTSSMHT